MCGVIGVATKNADLDMIRNLFRQSMIRGKHATGITYVYEGELRTHKQGISAQEFLDTFDLEQIVDSDGSVAMVGHIRYSTSDLRYNQPFSNEKVSIVHNGVISQEDPSTWKYKTDTSNDSELILKSLEEGNRPLREFRPSSMAVIELHKNKTLVGYRNEARPLWYTKVETGVVFTSTKDIATRSGLTSPTKCGMFVEYHYNTEADKIVEINASVKENLKDLQC